MFDGVVKHEFVLVQRNVMSVGEKKLDRGGSLFND
jgi:hypothetical protein